MKVYVVGCTQNRQHNPKSLNIRSPEIRVRFATNTRPAITSICGKLEDLLESAPVPHWG
jgi:hypothetical protein